MLDASEEVLHALEAQTGKTAGISGGKNVQQDLKALAAGLAEHPELDAQVYALLG
jgi:hypothetical protein